MTKNDLTVAGMHYDAQVHVDAPIDNDRILSQSGLMLRAMWDKFTGRCTIERAGGRLEVAVSRFSRYYATTDTYYVVSVPCSNICVENYNPHHVLYKLRERGATGVDAETIQMAVSKLVSLMDSVEEVPHD